MIHSLTINEGGIAMIWFVPSTKGISKQTIEWIPNRVLIDLDKGGNLIGIEILDPSITEELFGSISGKISKKLKLDMPIGAA